MSQSGQSNTAISPVTEANKCHLKPPHSAPDNPRVFDSPYSAEFSKFIVRYSEIHMSVAMSL